MRAWQTGSVHIRNGEIDAVSDLDATVGSRCTGVIASTPVQSIIFYSWQPLMLSGPTYHKAEVAVGDLDPVGYSLSPARGLQLWDFGGDAQRD